MLKYWLVLETKALNTGKKRCWEQLSFITNMAAKGGGKGNRNKIVPMEHSVS